MMLLEHRYYGKSHPTPDLRYCSRLVTWFPVKNHIIVVPLNSRNTANSAFFVLPCEKKYFSEIFYFALNLLQIGVRNQIRQVSVLF